MISKQENPPEKNFTTSEEGGLSFLRDTDLSVYAPGISTVGRVEVEMARRNPNRSIVGTTVDEKGVRVTRQAIQGMGLANQIQVKLEDLTKKNSYLEESFDYIYARLVLHYLSAQDLDIVLEDFHRVLNPGGRLFVVVRSEKNIPEDKETIYDEGTRLTTIVHPEGSPEVRYFHTPESITEHLHKAGFFVEEINEYTEKLFMDFERTKRSPYLEDHLIEIRASKG